MSPRVADGHHHAPAPTSVILATAAPLSVIGRGPGGLPGAKVLFAKLYADPEAMDTILIGHLRTLLERNPGPAGLWTTPADASTGPSARCNGWR